MYVSRNEVRVSIDELQKMISELDHLESLLLKEYSAKQRFLILTKVKNLFQRIQQARPVR